MLSKNIAIRFIVAIGMILALGFIGSMIIFSVFKSVQYMTGLNESLYSDIFVCSVLTFLVISVSKIWVLAPVVAADK